MPSLNIHLQQLMTPINDFLQRLGLTDKEALIYTTLLELGPQAASVIAKKTNIVRSSTFFHLENLIQKGFVKKDLKAHVQYFSALSPEDLEHLLQRQQQRVQDQLQQLQEFLPVFKNLQCQFLPESKVSYFEGVEGICNMIDLQLKNDEPLYFISAHRFHPEIRRYIRENYVTKRKKMKSKAQMIVTNIEDAKDYVGYANPVYEWVGFVDAKEVDFESTIVIYGNTIHFLSPHSENINGVAIENVYLAKTLKAVFELIKLGIPEGHTTQANVK